MTTTAPSWLPAYPATWQDIQQTYEQTVPRQFPEGLYDPALERDEHKDVLGLADVLAWVAQAAEWVKRSIVPHQDSQGLFLGRWETALGLMQAATVALRQSRIVAALRTRKTLTKEVVRGIFQPLIDPAGVIDDVEFRSPTVATLATALVGCNAAEITAAQTELFQMGIFSLNGVCSDLQGAMREARRRQPAWERWWIGTSVNADGYMYWDETNWDEGAWG
jgi:hypothetical protein